MSRTTEDLERDLADISQDVDVDEEEELSIAVSDFLSDHKTEKFDSFEAYQKYKNFIMDEVKKEVSFKRKARMVSLILLGTVGVLMIANVLFMLYAPGMKIGKHRVPVFSEQLVLAMITATFVNLFAIIAVVFKYVFSSTNEMLNHTKEINGG
ncbi:hypothetical protein M3152_10940 [Sporosarcina luteola]|uniref:hypothetical protein n=1 Tax=Sporosarcina luteola TaxID=582850 RepID=UPI0020416AA0|nr:hypothetical protein [Sporosarcina luteola]MCM3638241.1 hypothetical protein [Sporosarcina luteola]